MPESTFIPARKFYDIFLKSFDNVIELCPPGELQEGGPRDGTPEGPEDEEGGSGALR